MTIGKQFLSALVAENPGVSDLVAMGDIADLFKANETDVYKFVRDFVKKFGKLPTPETIQAHTGEELVSHKEPSAYYMELMQIRHIQYELKNGMKKAADLLMPGNLDAEQALKVITKKCMQLIAHKYQKQVADVRHAWDLIKADYASKWKALDDHGLQFGWPTLDNMTGGLIRGDMISFVGRPASGKTWQMLHGALYGWNRAGIAELAAKAKSEPVPEIPEQSRLFVSMEMQVLPIMQRIAAMQSHLPASMVKHSTLSTASKTKLRDSLLEVQGYSAPFYVVDGNLAATVEDICVLARQLKPAAIFIDGAYLVKHPTERDRYRRVAENAELMKKELTPFAPTAVSWQFAKTAAKKKKGEQVGLEDIGYSDAIAQVSSLVLGIFEEESLETAKHRKIEVLKGRSGEKGSFTTNWDFDAMNFQEVVEQDIESLQFS